MDNNMLIEHFKRHYGEYFDDIRIAYCPYRICPIGAHVDHQHGVVLGFAINYGIGIAYTIMEDEVCQLISHNYKGRKRFLVNSVMEKKNDWADYLRGAIKALAIRGHKLTRGINAYIYGELPIGGLSSSAAVIISFLKAITDANDIKLTNEVIIECAYEAEVDFVGMAIGILDPSCEVLCKKDKLLVLDTNDGKYKTIPYGKNKNDYRFLIIHCGCDRLLSGSYYNIRVDECKAAAFICKSYLEKYIRFKDTYLRDLPYEDFMRCRDNMPQNFRKRAEHYYNECDRVRRGEQAWVKGDIVEFGKLVSESGKSSIELYESGSQLLIDLYNIILYTRGVYGTRFMGGGFNGACLAIINPEYVNEIIYHIKNEYCRLHPELKDKVQLFVCTSEDGIGE